MKKQDIQYLQDIFQNPELVAKWRLDRRKIIGIDPGKRNLIECVDGKGKNANLFSYSYYQRRFEKQSKVYDKKRKELKRNSGLEIEAEETNLSTENSKVYFFVIIRVFSIRNSIISLRLSSFIVVMCFAN